MSDSPTGKREILEGSNSLSEHSRWNNLRTIGNSSIAKASIIVPVLGYIILFHDKLIDYLNLHLSFCAGCSVSWRLLFIYFGCCAFALGSLLYGFFCPLVIKRHEAAHNFFEEESDYFGHPEHVQFLASLIDREKRKTYLRPSVQYRERDDRERTSTSHLSAMMGENYFLQNRSLRWARIAIFLLYSIGGLLLAFPTVVTFVQVLKQSVTSAVTN